MDNGRIWIDIETSAGVKVGSGPITSATSWRNVRRLSRAGTFDFTMPAGDPKAVNLASKRVARCYGLVDGAVTELGAGIIDEIALQPGRGGVSFLQVRGDDLLRELTYRTVGTLTLEQDDQRTADRVELWTPPSSFTTLTNAFDGNPATEVSVYQAGSWLLIGDANVFDRLEINIGTSPNSGGSTLSMMYYNGVAPLTNYGFVSQTITDGTSSGGITMAQDGVVSFDEPDDWIKTTLNGQNLYWVVLTINTAVSYDLAEVDCIFTGAASDTALADVMALAPDGWDLDEDDGYGATTNPVHAEFMGQSVLQTLIALADAIGEHFILGPGRTVQWLQTDTPAAPVRAVSGSSTTGDLPDELALLNSIERTYSSFDLVTRVYPLGAELADGTFVSLAQSSAAASTGYTLSTANNYVEHDANTVTYGRIERTIQWTEVKPVSEKSENITDAANALLGKAEAYLAQNSAPVEQYRLSLLTREILTPGMLLPVVCQQWSDGYHAVDIDADLVILEATTEITAQGIRTTQLEVATTMKWVDSDQTALARSVATQKEPRTATVWQAA